MCCPPSLFELSSVFILFVCRLVFLSWDYEVHPMLGEKAAWATVSLHLYILSYIQVQRYPSPHPSVHWQKSVICLFSIVWCNQLQQRWKDHVLAGSRCMDGAAEHVAGYTSNLEEFATTCWMLDYSSMWTATPLIMVHILGHKHDKRRKLWQSNISPCEHRGIYYFRDLSPGWVA